MRLLKKITAASLDDLNSGNVRMELF
jgi:hypothetical protein